MKALLPISTLLLSTTFPTHTYALKIPNTQDIISPSDSPVSDLIHDILTSNEIIPQVLADFSPTYTIDISYDKNHHSTVSLGNDLPVKSVQKRPTFTFSEIPPSENRPFQNENSTFTLILTDPDARSRDDPDWSEMCHWIVTNLTATPEINFDFGLSKKKKFDGEVVKYMAPSPPEKTGAHRYVFVLLKGDTQKVKAPEDRKHWGYGKVRTGVKRWAEENGLEVVGANFFFARNKKQ